MLIGERLADAPGEGSQPGAGALRTGRLLGRSERTWGGGLGRHSAEGQGEAHGSALSPPSDSDLPQPFSVAVTAGKGVGAIRSTMHPARLPTLPRESGESLSPLSYQHVGGSFGGGLGADMNDWAKRRV